MEEKYQNLIREIWGDERPIYVFCPICDSVLDSSKSIMNGHGIKICESEVNGTFVNYCGNLGIVVKTGEELSKEFGSDNDDHLGVWFGDSDNLGNPYIWTIPTEYVIKEIETSKITPIYKH